MDTGQGARDRQTQTGSTVVAAARVIETYQPLKDSFALLGGYPGAGVGNRYLRTAVDRGDDDRDGATGGCVAPGIVGEIGQYLRDAAGVGANGECRHTGANDV
jgi:hypothetical protein